MADIKIDVTVDGEQFTVFPEANVAKIIPNLIGFLRKTDPALDAAINLAESLFSKPAPAPEVPAHHQRSWRDD